MALASGMVALIKPDWRLCRTRVFSFSNNLSENSIRPVTVGRKNWLFSDTPEGAQANTLYLTVVEMAKAYGLDLYKYLNFLFEQRPSRDMSDEELEKLAPWNESVKELCSIK